MRESKRFYVNSEKIPEGRSYTVSEEPGPHTFAAVNGDETVKAVLRLCTFTPKDT